MEFDYNKNLKNISALCEKYSFLERNVIGKSVVGRDIPILSFGNGKDELLYLAAFHGNESITTMIVMLFIEEICEVINNTDHPYHFEIIELLHKRRFNFVPIVNPDGCEISAKGEMAAGVFEKTVKKLSNGDYIKWSANARGIDINHNFNAKWEELHEIERLHGVYGPGSSHFGGKSPESEPETKAIANFCRNHNIIRSFALGSGGEVIYWDFDKFDVKSAYKIASLLSDASGYALDYPTGLALGGNFKDWFILEFRRPAFSIKIGKNENTSYDYTSEKIYKKIKKMLFESLFV